MRYPIAALIACAMLFAGCGGDDGSGADVPAEFFGVAPEQPPNEVDFSRMGSGEVGSFHLPVLWPQIEPERGGYNWELLDQTVTELAANEIKPVPVLFGTPGYLTEETTLPPTTSREALAGWQRFVTAAAERYGTDGTFWSALAESEPSIEPQPIDVWEIWNEMNGPAFWHGDPSPEEYARLLKRSAEAIREVDPDAEIMVGGMFATPSSDQAIVSFDFLEQLYEEDGVAEAADVVAVHPYGPNLDSVRRQIERTREIVDAADPDADIWVTELGWGSDPDAGTGLAKSPEAQARALERSFQMLVDERDDWRVRGVIWYAWRDPDREVAACAWCPSAGLFERDLDPKPAWEAFTSFTGGES